MKRSRENEVDDDEVEGIEDTPGTDLSNSKITKAIKEESEGAVTFRVVANDSTDESMILLTGLRSIFQKQLPNMPKEYIAKLVFDKSHIAMVVVKHPRTVLGGITYKPFDDRRFAEIVFCAIDTTCQVQGYGSRLMAHVKDHVMTAHNSKYFLTYADNYAIGYFKKQGFTTDITLDRAVWMGYIKDYEGGTIMQCTMIEKMKYLDSATIVAAQRWAVFKKIKEATLNSAKVYKGIDFGVSGSLDPNLVPGLRDAGWVPNAGLMSHRPTPRHRGPLYIFMKKLLDELHESTHSWPFVEPVAGVPDYYDVIKNPMDLRTLAENIESNKYQTVEEFTNDVNLIWTNCRLYNQDGSTYVKCASKLEKWFKERFKILQIEMRVV
ncbi:hypothetical protein BC833DRAFT_536072 [Globomyces pollinis-pini]|nr:hypothetical protein BC833DRAFT_536072 [Globomyces pollinis-pini]